MKNKLQTIMEANENNNSIIIISCSARMQVYPLTENSNEVGFSFQHRSIQFELTQMRSLALGCSIWSRQEHHLLCSSSFDTDMAAARNQMDLRRIEVYL